MSSSLIVNVCPQETFSPFVFMPQANLAHFEVTLVLTNFRLDSRGGIKLSSALALVSDYGLAGDKHDIV